MSRVSVVVPIYNAGLKLHKCIKSVLNQTFQDFELILVNDGSTDNSLKICKKYQKQDNRIVVINKENEGSIETRRRGVQSSKSEYVMFVDADDWIKNNTIEVLYKNILESKADIIVCNIYKVIGNGYLIKRENKSNYFNKDKIYVKEEIMRELVVAYFHGHPFPSSLYAKLYKKEYLINCGKYLENISFLGDDLFYNLEIFLKVNKVKVIEQPLYFYRSGGFTSKYMPKLFEDAVNGYKIQKNVIDDYYRDSISKQYNGISIMLLNTFKTCLYNLFNSNLSESEKKDLILKYVCDNNIQETLNNSGVKKYFTNVYLDAIKYKNIDYLFIAK